MQHVPEIHRLAAHAGGDFQKDLASHRALIDRLQKVSARRFAQPVV